METTIAFRAVVIGNEFADAPSCLVLTITNALRQQILDATTAIRQFGFKQVEIRCGLLAPKTCSDETGEALDDADYVRVAAGEFDETDEQRVDSMAVVVDDTDLWLRCNDHCCDQQIESPPANIVDVLALVPIEDYA